MISLLAAALLAAAPAPASTLTLDDALRQAVQHQPALQSAQHQAEAAAARLETSRAVEYPAVHADAELFGSTDNNTATAYLSPQDFARVGTRPRAELGAGELTPFVSSLAGVGAHYDVLDFGFTKGTVGAAEAQEKASRHLAGQTEQDVLLRVAVSYFNALAAEEALRVSQDTLKRAQEHDALAQAGVKSGLKPPIDLPRSEADVQAARLGVIRAQNALDVAHAALDAAIGWVPSGPYALVTPAEDTRAVPDPGQASNTALAGRLDLMAVQDEERALEQARTAAHSGYFPRLTATSSVSLRGFDGAPETVNYDLGLVLSVPLFTGFAVQGQVAEVDARLADLQAREAALRQGIGYQLRQSRETLLSAREAVKASQAQVQAARASLDLAEGRYKQGLGNIVELTDAEAQYDAAQLGLVQSKLTAAISRAQLDYALGELRAP